MTIAWDNHKNISNLLAFTIFFKTAKQTSSVETFDDYATVFKQNSVENLKLYAGEKKCRNSFLKFLGKK